MLSAVDYGVEHPVASIAVSAVQISIALGVMVTGTIQTAPSDPQPAREIRFGSHAAQFGLEFHC